MHANNERVWEYVSRFAEFNRLTIFSVVNYHGALYSLLFHMYTFSKMQRAAKSVEEVDKVKERYI